MVYPGDWQVGGNIQATEFADGAKCQSVEIIDLQSGPPPAPGAFILHSFVQVCARPVTDGLTLDEFMRQTYGDTLLDRFARVELNGIPVYEASGQAPDRTLFLQTEKHRLQIVASVVAEPEKRSERLAQVQQILESFSVVPR